MRKFVLGLVAATVALPSLAAAQPGYYDPYEDRGRYTHPADRNRDGVVTQRELRRYEQEMQRYYGSSGANYGSSGGYYGSTGSYSNNGGYYGNNGGYYGSNGGYYGNDRYGGSGSGYYGNDRYSSNSYGQYYDRNGYYSGPTWRGDDGRYHCRRSDGTTGTIVGGAAGALIGRSVAGRGDRTLGTIIGGAIGAVIGNSVERGGRSDRYRCN